MLGTFRNWTEIVGRTLAREGHDLTKLLEERGVDLTNDQSDRLSPETVWAIWDAVEEVSSDPVFGLSMLNDLDYSDFEELGVAIVVHTTLESALQCLVEYHKLLSDYVELSLDRSGDQISMSMSSPGIAHWRAFEFSAVMLVRGVRVRYGRDVDPVRVALGFENEAAASIYRRYFRCPVEFGADKTEVTYNISRPIRQGDPPPSRVVARFELLLAEQLKALTSDASWGARVGDEVIRQLVKGVPTLDQVAHALHVSSRTLQRYLAEEELSYREIVENCRRRLARNWVRNQQHSLTDITFLLGFSSSSAFSRAYRRWYGVPPRADRLAARRPAA